MQASKNKYIEQLLLFSIALLSKIFLLMQFLLHPTNGFMLIRLKSLDKNFKPSIFLERQDVEINENVFKVSKSK